MALDEIHAISLQLLAIVSAIVVEGIGVWLAYFTEIACIPFLRWTPLLLGAPILCTTMFLRSFSHNSIHALRQLIVIGCLSSLLLGFLALNDRLTGNHNYSASMVTNPRSWKRVESCLAYSSFCNLTHKNLSRLSPLQERCCIPPKVCGFQPTNIPTCWVNATTPQVDSDCTLWRNNHTSLCYSCSACQGGMLRSIRRRLNVACIATSITMGITNIIYGIGFYLILRSEN